MIKVKADPTYEKLGFNQFMTRNLLPADRKFQTAEDFNAQHLDGAVINKKIFDVNTDKIKIAPKDKTGINVFEIFYLGLVDIPITGGTVDGGTYTWYYLDVYIHHNFSDFADAVPFYEFWAYYNEYGRETKQTHMFPVIDTSSGAYTTTNTHAAWRSQWNLDIANDTEEVLNFKWILVRTSGSVVIPEQTLQMYLALQYARDVNLLSDNINGQGGGGGVLYEKVDITL